MVWEFFAGCADRTKAHVQIGWAALSPIHSAWHPQFDLTNMLLVEKILMIAATGRITIAHFGTPCSSMPIAIAPPVRSKEFPEGAPWMSNSMKFKIFAGDLQSQIILRLAVAFTKSRTHVSDENPQISWHWHFIDAKGGHDILPIETDLDYCAYGTTWRKTNRIRSAREHLHWLGLCCTCAGKHVQLRGSIVLQGRRLPSTLTAAPYPIRLVKLWAHVNTSLSPQHANKLFDADQRHSFMQSFASVKHTCGHYGDSMVIAQAYFSSLLISHALDLGGPQLHSPTLSGTCLSDVGLSIERVLQSGTCVRYSHIDDHIVLGDDTNSVESIMREWTSRLSAAGFSVQTDLAADPVERYIGLAATVSPAVLQIPTTVLGLLDKALGHLLSSPFVAVELLHSVVGDVQWYFLLRRLLLPLLHATYGIFLRFEPQGCSRLPRNVRDELRAVKRLLSLAFGDIGKQVLPVVFAQDAEGVSECSLGGWGFGFLCLPPAKFPNLIRVTVDSSLKGVPRFDVLESPVSLASKEATGDTVPAFGDARVTDPNIPHLWTDNRLQWNELLTRAHSYPESIRCYEGRVIVRSLGIVAKLGLSPSILLAFEDNAAVTYCFARGRSRDFKFNQICRKRCAIELISNIGVHTAWLGTQQMPMDKFSGERILQKTVVSRITRTPLHQQCRSSRA